MRGTTNEIDVEIAQRIRRRRMRLGISQKQVADHLGISFQQVQKYERAETRISASALQKLCGILKTSAEYLFDGVNETTPVDRRTADQPSLTNAQRQLLNDFDEIKDPAVQASILHLVSTICGRALNQKRECVEKGSPE